MKPTKGRIVLVNLAGKVMAAIIVAAWTDTCINVVAFCDGSNDFQPEYLVRWGTSLNYTDDVTLPLASTWTWPPKV